MSATESFAHRPATIRASYATSRDGTPIAYWCTGRGDPILIVHGLGSTHLAYQAFTQRLAPGFTGCTMDRRGRGESGDTEPYAFEREGEDVAAVAEALGHAVVLGHSYGGPAAIEAATASEAVRALVLYEAWTSPHSTIPAEDLAAIEELVSKGRYADAFHYFDSPEEIEEEKQKPDYAVCVAAAPTIPREIRGWARYWQDHPLDDQRWRALDKPVLLLVGELNADERMPTAVRLADRLPRATIQLLEGQGHVAHREDPDQLARIIRSWLEATEAAGNDQPGRD